MENLHTCIECGHQGDDLDFKTDINKGNDLFDMVCDECYRLKQ